MSKLFKEIVGLNAAAIAAAADAVIFILLITVTTGAVAELLIEADTAVMETPPVVETAGENADDETFATVAETFAPALIVGEFAVDVLSADDADKLTFGCTIDMDGA